MAHITNKELTIRQIGEFCTNTLCNKCPVAKWNAGVGLQLTIDYDDIEADTEAEAIQIAKERALEDIEWNNCDCDASNPIVYYCQKKETEEAEDE